MDTTRVIDNYRVEIAGGRKVIHYNGYTWPNEHGIDTVEAWQHHMGYAFDRLGLSDEEYAQLMLFVCNIGESMDSMFGEGFTYELAKFFDGVYRHLNGLE